MTEEKGNYRRDWLVVFLLLATMVFSFVDRFGISVLIAPLKENLRITDAEIGLLHGLPFGLFYSIMGLPLGWLADKWSRKGTIAVGLAIWSTATSVSAFCTTFPHLLFARIWVGAGEAALAPAAYGIVHSRFPNRLLGRAMSVFQIGSQVGAGLAVTIAGFLFVSLDQNRISVPLFEGIQPWQETFFLLGLPGIVLLPLILLIRDDKPHRPAQDAAAPAPGLWASLAGQWRLYAISFVAMSLINMVTYSMLSWAPAILGREFGVAPDKVGTSYGLVVVCFAPLGMLFGGWLADRLASPEKPQAYLLVPLLTTIVALPGLILFGTATTQLSFMVALALLHFALPMAVGVVPAFLQIITPEGTRGRVSALYVLVVNVFGLGAAPTLIGALSAAAGDDVGGLRHAVHTATLPALCASGCLLILYLRRHIFARVFG